MLVLNYGLASSVANSPHLVETVRQLLAFISELEASLAHLQEERDEMRSALSRLADCSNIAEYEPGYINKEVAARIEYARKHLTALTVIEIPLGEEIARLRASLAHLQENTPTPEEAKALYDHGPRADRITHAFTDAAAFKSGWAKLRALSASEEPK